MKIKFTKMHGCGNDYVYINAISQKLSKLDELARFVSDRHFAIGSDGMVLICPSEKGDFRMRMFNPDGTEGEMCGNALRSMSKYVYEHNLTDKTNLTIETQNNKKYNIKEVEYNNERELLKYKYEKNNNDGKIRVENILDIQLADKQEERNYIYTLLEKHYGALNLKEKIENFEKYYLEIIDILFSKEQIGAKGYLNLKNKKNMYPHIFENLYKDKENLLFYYFSEKKIKKKQQSEAEIENEKLLIEQANLSQKEALKNAINNKMSIIQGPPGTGKTTTILNILANLIYQNMCRSSNTL